MIKTKPLPPIELLRSLLDYNPETGEITWKVTRNGKVKAGQIAGTVNERGYRKITVKEGRYKRCLKASRIAWYLHYGDDPVGFVIDHINRNPDDNWIHNLRKISQRENLMNRSVTKCFKVGPTP